MPSASSCELIEVEMCQGLSYNLTSFPNIWLSIADQREAAALLRQYRVTTTFTTTYFPVAVSRQTFNPTHSPYFSFCRPGADGAGVLRALAEAGVRDVSAPVQPSGWRSPALPLSLLLRRAAVQPSPGPLLLQLALQLPPPA